MILLRSTTKLLRTDLRETSIEFERISTAVSLSLWFSLSRFASVQSCVVPDFFSRVILPGLRASNFDLFTLCRSKKNPACMTYWSATLYLLLVRFNEYNDHFHSKPRHWSCHNYNYPQVLSRERAVFCPRSDLILAFVKYEGCLLARLMFISLGDKFTRGFIHDAITSPFSSKFLLAPSQISSLVSHKLKAQ